jgi:hypothetical protein
MSTISGLNFGLTLRNSSNSMEWGTSHIIDKEGAFNLLKQFEEAFCLYSPATEMLYPAYNVTGLDASRNKVKIMPMIRADSEPYHSIPVDCVSDSDFRIIPGALIGKTGLYISINKYKALPLTEGLKTILREECCGRTCLPVLMEGGLRELGREFAYPYLQLSCLQIDQIHSLSVFERSDIAHMVTEKLKGFVLNKAAA